MIREAHGRDIMGHFGKYAILEVPKEKVLLVGDAKPSSEFHCKMPHLSKGKDTLNGLY